MTTLDTTTGEVLPPAKRPIAKVVVILLAASLVGSLAALPFSIALMKQTGVAIPPNLPEPFFWNLVMVASVVIEMVFSTVAIVLGLWLGSRVGLGVPRLEAWLAGHAAPGHWRRSLPLALGLGLAVGVVILVLAKLGKPLVPEQPRHLTMPSAWEGFLVSIGAGIREELWFRLGLMTFLVWIGSKLTGGREPGAMVLWTGNLLAALLFGAMHLPQASALIGLTAPFVAYVLLLNGVGGVAFGWLYWRHGLLAAMLAHFSTDVVLKVVVVLLPWK